MSNCSNLPLSQDFFAEIQTELICLIAVASVLTLCTIVLFIEEVVFIFKTYKFEHVRIALTSMWLISIYPVVATTSLLAVMIPRASYFCDFVAICYVSLCFFQFSSLLLLYFGGPEHLLTTVKSTGFSFRARPLCCCCRCCPILPADRKSLTMVRVLVFQGALLQPIIQFISAVLWVDEKFVKFGIDFTEPYIYLNIMRVTTTLFAVYGIQILQTTTRSHLRTFNTVPKQVALTLVNVFLNIQGTLFTIPARFEVPACRNGMSSFAQVMEWHHLLLVLEMFLFSLFVRVFYRRPLEMDARTEETNRKGDIVSVYTSEVPIDEESKVVTLVVPSGSQKSLNKQYGTPAPVDVQLSQPQSIGGPKAVSSSAALVASEVEKSDDTTPVEVVNKGFDNTE